MKMKLPRISKSNNLHVCNFVENKNEKRVKKIIKWCIKMAANGLYIFLFIKMNNRIASKENLDHVSFLGVHICVGEFFLKFYKGKFWNIPCYYLYSHETDLIRKLLSVIVKKIADNIDMLYVAPFKELISGSYEVDNKTQVISCKEMHSASCKSSAQDVFSI